MVRAYINIDKVTKNSVQIGWSGDVDNDEGLEEVWVASGTGSRRAYWNPVPLLSLGIDKGGNQTFTGLKPDTAYQAQVIAYGVKFPFTRNSSKAVLNYRTPTDTPTTPPPTTPISISFSGSNVTGRTANFKWSGATTYDYRYRFGFGNYTSWTTGSSNTSFSVTIPSNQTSAQIHVKGYSGSLSAEGKHRLTIGNVTPPTPKPGTPSLSLRWNSNASVLTLSFSASNATGYETRVDGGGGWESWQSTTSTSRSVPTGSLSAGQVVKVEVRGKNSAGTGPTTSSQAVKPSPGTPPTQPPPVGVRCSCSEHGATVTEHPSGNCEADHEELHVGAPPPGTQPGVPNISCSATTSKIDFSWSASGATSYSSRVAIGTGSYGSWTTFSSTTKRSVTAPAATFVTIQVRGQNSSGTTTGTRSCKTKTTPNDPDPQPPDPSPPPGTPNLTASVSGSYSGRTATFQMSSNRSNATWRSRIVAPSHNGSWTGYGRESSRSYGAPGTAQAVVTLYMEAKDGDDTASSSANVTIPGTGTPPPGTPTPPTTGLNIDLNGSKSGRTVSWSWSNTVGRYTEWKSRYRLDGGTWSSWSNGNTFNSGHTSRSVSVPSDNSSAEIQVDGRSDTHTQTVYNTQTVERGQTKNPPGSPSISCNAGRGNIGWSWSATAASQYRYRTWSAKAGWSDWSSWSSTTSTSQSGLGDSETASIEVQARNSDGESSGSRTCTTRDSTGAPPPQQPQPPPPKTVPIGTPIPGHPRTQII